ncbi:MAG: S41 family peptidase [Rhizobiaceae bacterium]|nr:S41 family peptidase [Rhizobiaceae bacterium]
MTHALSSERISRDLILEDVNRAKLLLRKIHPNLYAHRSQRELEKIWAGFEEKLPTNPTRLDAASLLQQILASVCDLHTYVSIDHALASNNLVGNSVFPTGLIVDGDKLYLDESRYGNTTREVISINQKSSTEIISFLRSIYSVDGCQKREKFFTFHIGSLYKSSVLLTNFIGSGTEFNVKFKNTKSHDIEDRIYSSLSTYKLSGWRVTGSPGRSELLKKIGIEARAGLWKYDQGAHGRYFVRSNQDKSAYYVYVPNFRGGKSWVREVNRTLRELVAANPKHVVIDLTDNTGGLQINTQRFLSYFLTTSSSFGVSVRTKVNTPDFGKEFEWRSKKVERDTTAYLKYFKRAKKVNRQYKLSTRRETFGNKSYNGNLTVLVSPQTLSAGTFAAITLKRKTNARIVGDIGDISLTTSCASAAGSHALKNTRVKLSIPYECNDRHQAAKSNGNVGNANVPVDILKSNRKFLSFSILKKAIETEPFLNSLFRNPNSVSNVSSVKSKISQKLNPQEIWPKLKRPLELTSTELKVHSLAKPNKRKPNFCDVYAASPFDEDRLVKFGIPFSALIVNPNNPIAACRLAIKQYPNDRTTIYQTARAHHAAGINFGSQKYYDVAYELYSKLSSKGHHLSTVNLSGMFYSGQGVGKDKEKGIELARLALETGDSSIAKYRVGYYLYKEQKYVEAAQFLIQASTDKFIRAGSQNLLDKIYSKGEAVETITQQLLTRYRKAEGETNHLNLLIMANFYSWGVTEENSDRKAAIYGLHWFRKTGGAIGLRTHKAESLWSVETRIEFQRLLNELGLYSGRLNGKIDSDKVREAVEKLKEKSVEIPPLPID